ncbi:hypothetical protein DVW87_12355 [Sphingomonas aracearum]|uniref:Uncharacterized protein n=1 Tax=Sphingomonas aracearum TaxID=2283317 RepID=A0A369VUB4_9SPHN|nr:hypothetical protein DVW87_12355 [Sphingomonas aracearum]
MGVLVPAKVDFEPSNSCGESLALLNLGCMFAANGFENCCLGIYLLTQELDSGFNLRCDIVDRFQLRRFQLCDALVYFGDKR